MVFSQADSQDKTCQPPCIYKSETTALDSTLQRVGNLFKNDRTSGGKCDRLYRSLWASDRTRAVCWPSITSNAIIKELHNVVEKLQYFHRFVIKKHIFAPTSAWTGPGARYVTLFVSYSRFGLLLSFFLASPPLRIGYCHIVVAFFHDSSILIKD